MHRKKVAILQSNYIPWKGYFDIINSVDLFILLDSVQYTKNDWRNRNKIKTASGVQWLTIPVSHSYLGQPINEVDISTTNWQDKHWKTLANAYAKAPYFKPMAEALEPVYRQQLSGVKKLSDVNALLLRETCKLLSIHTEIVDDRELGTNDGKNERLINLCQKVAATDYFSGPAAKAYIDEGLFREAGIEVHWMDYSGYPDYPQLYPPFEHGVSILDLIFNMGSEARNYLKSTSAHA